MIDYDRFSFRYHINGKDGILIALDQEKYSLEEENIIKSYLNNNVAKCPECSYYFFQSSIPRFDQLVINRKKKIVVVPDSYIYFRLSEDDYLNSTPVVQCPICFLERHVEFLPIWTLKENFLLLRKLGITPNYTEWRDYLDPQDCCE